MTDTTALTTQAAHKPPQVGSGAPLAAMVPTNIEEAFRLSKALASSGDMVPKHFQGKPEMCMAAIMRGMEVGLAPMQALSSIAVINGRATIWGDALPALMLRAGHHVDVDYDGEGDALRAIATLTRGDTGKIIVRSFSMIDAKRAGLLGKQGPWQQYPTRMLAMRARSWAIRDGAADALMGMNIADEGEGPDAARDVTPQPTRRGGVSFHPIAPLPVRDEVVDADRSQEEPEQPAPLSDAASKLIARLERKATPDDLSALWNASTFVADVAALDDGEQAIVAAAFNDMFNKLVGVQE